MHGVIAAKELGFETIMINCNPETVSTDPDVSDKLYFEPVFWEHIYDIILHEQPEGVIVQLGGQTALKLAEKLERYDIKIIGTDFKSLDLAEDTAEAEQIPPAAQNVVEVGEDLLIEAVEATRPGSIADTVEDAVSQGRRGWRTPIQSALKAIWPEGEWRSMEAFQDLLG